MTFGKKLNYKIILLVAKVLRFGMRKRANKRANMMKEQLLVEKAKFIYFN
jgi:hypothetical protein